LDKSMAFFGCPIRTQSGYFTRWGVRVLESISRKGLNQLR
jgi:hypothetical protein